MAYNTKSSHSDSCLQIIERYLYVEEVADDEDITSYLIIQAKKGQLIKSLEELYGDLIKINCYMRVARTQAGLILQVAKGNEQKRRITLTITLAAITLLTVYVSGLSFAREKPNLAWSPVGYLLGLLVPLLIHEAGHYLVMRRLGVPRSLPYLLPAPPLQLGFIGTFGAVINMRWLPPRNRHLALIGIAGPIAGFLAAIPVAYYGIMNSVVKPATGLATLPLTPLIMLLFPLPKTPGPGEAVVLSPMAFSAYIVFFVTFLNLIPVAMLDGGHIVRSLLGEKGHAIVSQLVLALLLLGSLFVPGLLLFTLIVLTLHFMSRGRHPGSAINDRELDSVTVIIGIVYMILLVLTIPVPA
ncbi:MAG: site-2 protease family protein [Desulfurococcales archaeon]|nr:site-2 protease family protein [Desulfurococcales archaeon]